MNKANLIKYILAAIEKIARVFPTVPVMLSTLAVSVITTAAVTLSYDSPHTSANQKSVEAQEFLEASPKNARSPASVLASGHREQRGSGGSQYSEDSRSESVRSNVNGPDLPTSQVTYGGLLAPEVSNFGGTRIWPSTNDVASNTAEPEAGSTGSQVTISFGFAFATATSMAVSASSSTTASQNTVMNLPFTFGSDSSYSISSSRIELTGGVARLKPAAQVDEDDSASKFGGATLNGITWDGAGFLRLSGTGTAAELEASWVPAYASLLGYWKMNGNWIDASGNGNDLAAGGNATFSASSKMGSHAGAFDGTDDSAYRAAFSEIVINGTFSISGWIKTSGNAGVNGGTFFENATTGANRIAMAQTDNIIGCSYYNGVAWTRIGATFSGFNSWHHVACVKDASGWTFYLDGNAYTTDPGGTIYGGSNGEFRLGGNSSGNGDFSGNLDEFAIWSSALTAQQVSAVYERQLAKYSGSIISRVIDALAVGQSWTYLSYTSSLPTLKELPSSSGSESSSGYASTGGNLANGLLGLWHLNETALNGISGQDFEDKSGNGAHMDETGGASIARNGKFGFGIQLDGSTQYATSAPFTTDTAAGFTFSCWQKADRQGVITGSLFLTANNVSTFELFVSTDNTLRAWIRNDSAWHFSAISAAFDDWTEWHHIAGVYDGSRVILYRDGKQVAISAAESGALNGVTNRIRIGRGSNNNYLRGSLDEVSAWSRALSEAEISELYRRGANRLKFQVRSCSQSDCSDQDALFDLGWKGPDNSNATYFSELFNTQSNATNASVSTAPPSLTFSNFAGLAISSARYFQYRSVFESDDQNTLCNYGSGASLCSPELRSVTVGPEHYDTTVHSITSGATLGVSFRSLDAGGFSATLGSNGCPGGVRHALSLDGNSFFYWDGSAWAASNDYNTASAAYDISTHLSTFMSVAGTGTLRVKTYLKSNGATACEIDSIDVSGSM